MELDAQQDATDQYNPFTSLYDSQNQPTHSNVFQPGTSSSKHDLKINFPSNFCQTDPSPTTQTKPKSNRRRESIDSLSLTKNADFNSRDLITIKETDNSLRADDQSFLSNFEKKKILTFNNPMKPALLTRNETIGKTQMGIINNLNHREKIINSITEYGQKNIRNLKISHYSDMMGVIGRKNGNLADRQLNPNNPPQPQKTSNPKYRKNNTLRDGLTSDLIQNWNWNQNSATGMPAYDSKGNGGANFESSDGLYVGSEGGIRDSKTLESNLHECIKNGNHIQGKVLENYLKSYWHRRYKNQNRGDDIIVRASSPAGSDQEIQDEINSAPKKSVKEIMQDNQKTRQELLDRDAKLKKTIQEIVGERLDGSKDRAVSGTPINK
jgi:hypothetical protein